MSRVGQISLFMRNAWMQTILLPLMACVMMYCALSSALLASGIVITENGPMFTRTMWWFTQAFVAWTVSAVSAALTAIVILTLVVWYGHVYRFVRAACTDPDLVQVGL